MNLTQSSLILLLCSTFAVACTPSAGVTTNTYADTGVADVPTGLDRPVSPGDVVATDDRPVSPGDAVPNPDGTVDAGGSDVPADMPIAPSACRSSRECVRGVCDRVTSQCVECVTAAQCAAAAPVCRANRCAAAVACTSSRMCPGQVCDAAAGRCVDCVSDPDCTTGNVCVRNNCLPAPMACRSSRECAPLDQVCDASRGVCVDCVSDPDCPASQFCAGERTCAPQVCAPGARECVDLSRARVCNTNGSGWTESSCGFGASCVESRCQAQICTPGAASCGSMTQRRVCNPDGLGYTASACGAMESCTVGACRAWSCSPGATTCQSSGSVSVCNADGLGTRAMSCPGGSSCTGGRCSSWVCTPGVNDCASATERRVCNPDGLGYSPAPCALPAHATSTSCASGACGYTCEAGWGDCDGAPSNGCETDLTTTSSHCGMCNRLCSSSGGVGSTSACIAGACRVVCAPNYGDCDASPANGCEVFTASDVRHCGGCGAACAARPNSVASCTVGRCGYVCLSGYGDCDDNPANGCERILGTDTAHCGSCGNACPTGANALVTCASGACTFACSGGFSDCDNNRATGCEAPTSTDLANCGACGRRCAPANATGACSAGTCSVTACSVGFGDCDASASNGCEADLQTSLTHCGVCGRTCPGTGTPGTTVTCAAGVCGSVCVTNFSDCDGLTANGCEANLAADARNCGACGVLCPSGQSCVSRACTTAPPGSLSVGRYGLAGVTATDGRVYVFGGYNTDYVRTLERFDPATNGWTTRAPMPIARWEPVAAALPDGRVLSIGGYNAATSNSVYGYTPTTDLWATLASLRTGRRAAAAAVAGGRVYVFGGYASSALTSAEVYDPTANTWTAIRSLTFARSGAAAVTAPNGRIYVFGGATSDGGSTAVTSVEIYDPATDTYTSGPTLTTGRALFGAAIGGDGRAYLAGGYLGSYSSTVTAFTFSTGTYATVASMNVAHAYFPLAALPDGRLLAISGNTGSGSPTTRVEAYSTINNTWR